MPQARNAVRMIAANGLDDHEPKLDHDGGRHRVEVLARDDRGRVGVRESDGDGVEDHQRADAQHRDPDRPRHMARRVLGLLGRARARVEADEHPAADGQRREHPGRHRAARQRLGAERLAEHREVLLAKDEQQREADPDRRDRLGRDPGLDRAAERRDAQNAGQRADDDQCHPDEHDPVGRDLDPEQRQRPRRAEVGDRRVRRRVGAHGDPAGEPPVPAVRSGAASTGRRRR